MEKKRKRKRVRRGGSGEGGDTGRERELCPKQAAIKRALKKGQRKKRKKRIHNRQSK